jgi:hypothetical protein
VTFAIDNKRITTWNRDAPARLFQRVQLTVPSHHAEAAERTAYHSGASRLERDPNCSNQQLKSGLLNLLLPKPKQVVEMPNPPNTDPKKAH